MTKPLTRGAMFGNREVNTFLGLPHGDLSDLSAKGVILGVPGVTPYTSIGNYCGEGPKAIRDAIAEDAANLGHVDFDGGSPLFPGEPSVVDCGDLPFNEADFEANRACVRSAIGKILDAGAMPVVIGGDDSLPLPMLQSYAGRGQFTVLQIDAHIDWRDEVQDERDGLSSGMRRISEMEHVERIIQVGIRGIGSARPADLRDALDWGARIMTARDIARHGIAPVLELIPAGANVIVVLDCDGLDPSIMPAVLARAPGGLGYWDVIELLEGVATKGHLAGFEMAEFKADADIDGLGGITAARIVANVVRLAALREDQDGRAHS